MPHLVPLLDAFNPEYLQLPKAASSNGLGLLLNYAAFVQPPAIDAGPLLAHLSAAVHASASSLVLAASVGLSWAMLASHAVAITAPRSPRASRRVPTLAMSQREEAPEDELVKVPSIVITPVEKQPQPTLPPQNPSFLGAPVVSSPRQLPVRRLRNPGVPRPAVPTNPLRRGPQSSPLSPTHR
eukprot:EG_transcript_13747